MGRVGGVFRALTESSAHISDRDLPVFGLAHPVAEARDRMNLGLVATTRDVAASASALARRLAPSAPGEVVELEPMDDDRPGWMPRDDEEVA